MTANELRQRPFLVRLFMLGGDPNGVKTIEKSNWTGRGLVIPRPLFGQTRTRDELQQAGVYLLVGDDEQSRLPRMYVGERDPVGPRLDQHAKNKDFWTHAIAFTSKDRNLHKAHVQHLESRLIELARVAKRCTMDNLTTPQAPSLSEADTAEVEGFLADVLLCLPVLGYGFFEAAPAPKAAAYEFLLTAPGKGIAARGFESAAGFVVREGSKAAKEEVRSIHAYLSQLRRSLIEQGVFTDKGTHYEVTQDYVFASPSNAAGAVLGRSANGRIEWKTADGRLLKAIQEAEASG